MIRPGASEHEKDRAQMRQVEVDHLGAAPTVSIGGMCKGGFSGAIMAAGPQRRMKIAVA